MLRANINVCKVPKADLVAESAPRREQAWPPHPYHIPVPPQGFPRTRVPTNTQGEAPRLATEGVDVAQEQMEEKVHSSAVLNMRVSNRSRWRRGRAEGKT